MPLTPSQFLIENLPPECVEFIRRKEGKRLKAYRDPGGYALPTIGYGHTKGVTAADVESGRTITDAKAEEFLYARIWTSELQRERALESWNVHYNYHRPHGAHDGRPAAIDELPAQLLDDDRAHQLPVGVGQLPEDFGVI